MKRACVPRFIWAALIVATLFFIWSNSLRNAGESFRQSGRWVEFFLRFFPAEVVSMQTVSLIVRKTAHFCEFALLGFEVSGLWATFPKPEAPPLFLFPVACAALDEFLQTFSDRTASLKDVCLDSCGAFFGIGVFYLIVFIVRKFRMRRRVC